MELKINTICPYPPRYLHVPSDFPCKAPVSQSFFFWILVMVMTKAGSFMTCDGNMCTYKPYSGLFLVGKYFDLLIEK